jgi:hypothetical protein
MTLQTPKKADLAADRTAIIIRALSTCLTFSPTFSRRKYRHFWHRNQGDPGEQNTEATPSNRPRNRILNTAMQQRNRYFLHEKYATPWAAQRWCIAKIEIR